MKRTMVWKPCDVSWWPHGDEWSNEFSTAMGRSLTDGEMDAYCKWSECWAIGTASGKDEEFTYFWLLPLSEGQRGLPGLKIAYPTESLEEEPWYKINVAVWDVLQGVASDIWYDVWGESVPEAEEYVDVVIDRGVCELSEAQREWFKSIPEGVRYMFVLSTR